MDKVSQTFDEWAINGRSELMQKEHAKTVLKFLKSIKFEKPFSFLDVGCGNGWVVRKIASFENCKLAVGIDKSKNMIDKAKSKKKLQTNFIFVPIFKVGDIKKNLIIFFLWSHYIIHYPWNHHY